MIIIAKAKSIIFDRVKYSFEVVYLLFLSILLFILFDLSLLWQPWQQLHFCGCEPKIKGVLLLVYTIFISDIIIYIIKNKNGIH